MATPDDDSIGDDPKGELFCDVEKAKNRTQHYAKILQAAADFFDTELLERLEEAVDMERYLQDEQHEAFELWRELIAAVTADTPARTPRIEEALEASSRWLHNRG